MASLPDLFLPSEKSAFDDVLEDIAAGEASLFALRCRNLGPSAELAETLAAAFLLTNAMLMARSHRRIVKLISLDVADEAMRYGYGNAFRALFASEFSSLENVGHWHRMLEERQHIASGVLADAQKAIEFFRHADISASASAFHRASVYMGVDGASPGERAGGQFAYDDDNIYAPRLVGVGRSAPVALKSVYLAERVKLRTGRKGQNIVIELDCADAATGIANWLTHVDHLLALDFYRLGA